MPCEIVKPGQKCLPKCKQGFKVSDASFFADFSTFSFCCIREVGLLLRQALPNACVQDGVCVASEERQCVFETRANQLRSLISYSWFESIVTRKSSLPFILE